jgi:hypothetical protein
MPDFSWLQIVSYTINGMIFWQWLRGKLVLRRFLVGRWEGSFARTQEDGIAIHCTLYVTEHKDRDNTALFYYRMQDLKSSTICIQGCDVLSNYDEDPLFFHRRIWRPFFLRAMHVSHGNGLWNDVDMPTHYAWDCRINSLFFRPKMQVTIKAPDTSFSGVLLKH